MIKDSKNLIVYHGSVTPVKDIDLKFSKKYKDFGIGFYLTTDRKQAIKFAKIKARRCNSKISYLNKFIIKDFSNLKVIEFERTNPDWLDCFVGNRLKKFNYLCKKTDNADVIIGKIADDATSFALNAYIKGVYGDVESNEAKNMVVKMLKTDLLNDQVCLKTKKAIKKLKYIGSQGVYL